MAQHRAQRLTARSAAAELGLERARFYELYSDYLRACAHAQAETWSPGFSGGDHHPDWPPAVTALLTKLLSSKPASSYSAAASELHRRDQRHSIAAPPRSTVVRCLRPDGDLFYLHHAPDPKARPLVLLHCPVF